MKKNSISVLVTMICMFGVIACSKNESEPETVTLYDKPLQEIESYIQGKWKVYVSYGGVVGISYHQDTYVEYTKEYYITTYPDETITVPLIWKRLKTRDGYETYVISNQGSDSGVLYFHSIKGDTLVSVSYSLPFSTILVKVKK